MADRTLTIDLRAPVRLADLPALGRGLLAWWGGELNQLLPWRTAAGAPAQPLTTLYVRQDRWFVKAPGRPALVLDTSRDDEALGEQILHADPGMGLTALRLLLPRDHVMLRRLELPQVGDSYVRESVGLQIDRLTPFKAEAVRYACRIAGRDAEQHRLVVDVAAAPLERLRPIEQRVRALGLRIAAVDVEGEDGEGLGYDLSDPPGAAELRSRRRLNLALAVFAALTWGAAVYFWSHRGEGEIAQWEARIAELKPAAAQAAQVRRRVESAVSRIAAANRRQPVHMLDILAELTRVLPDNATVLDLRIEGGTASLSGLARQAPPLIGALERSTLFKDVKFTSPVVRKTGSTLETFEIVLTLEGAASS